MVNMMESSLAESMVPNANNIYDPMVSSLHRHPGPGSLMCRVSSRGQIVMFHVMFTPSTKMHTQGFRKKLVKIFSFPTQEMMNVI